jgi:short-subunit dehydrogenase
MSDGSPSFSDRYGPWALVLGASHGIGASFARQIAERGVNVVLVARALAALQETADEIRSASGVDVRAVSVDLTAPTMLDDLVRGTEDLDLGLVVYNAGGTDAIGRFVEGPASRPAMIVQLNCVGPVQVCHHFGGRLLERGRGGIILMSSLGGTCGTAGTATYSASKAFDLILAEGLWAELHPKGVDVLGLVVGTTNTPTFMVGAPRIDPDDFPGMEADDVAREGLENLANGPTWVAGDENRAAFDALRAMPRVDAVLAMSEGLEMLFGLDEA